jgi:ribosomal-protein-alanine N-acetyltransferase
MIRRIKESDIPFINEIVKNYDKDFMHHYTLDMYLDSDVYLMYLYEENNTIKGFIICNHLYEKMEILLLFVKDEFRNQGIGKKLVEYLYSLSEIITLEVSVENYPALHLYEKLGFKEVGRRPKYYKGIDALIMEKVIK